MCVFVVCVVCECAWCMCVVWWCVCVCVLNILLNDLLVHIFVVGLLCKLKGQNVVLA